MNLRGTPLSKIRGSTLPPPGEQASNSKLVNLERSDNTAFIVFFVKTSSILCLSLDIISSFKRYQAIGFAAVNKVNDMVSALTSPSTHVSVN